MKTVLTKSKSIACTLLLSFCLISFSCKCNNNPPTKGINNEINNKINNEINNEINNIKNIDNKTITFGTTINEQLSLTLNEYIVTEDSILLMLESKFHNDTISRKLVLPNSFGGYGKGAGFIDSFDSENLINQHFKRKHKTDFIIAQYLQRFSYYYYFKIEDTKKIILDRIFTIFRYSSNYGVEPEDIEINNYIINMEISEIDFIQYKNLTKKIQNENYNYQWRYSVKPNSSEIERN